MPMKYLNDSGLGYFWSKIKAWCNATFAAITHSHGNITNAGNLGTASVVVVTNNNGKITTSSVTSTELGYVSGVTSAIQTQLNGKAASSHNQASNTINAMTGYSKPSSGSAIGTGDTLNQAVGKLEAKIDAIDDSNLVHKTGNEIINGQKVFCFSENVDAQGTYSNLYKLFYRSLDSAIGDVYADGYDRYLRFDFQDKNRFRLGGLEYAFRSGGNYDIKIGARKIDGSGDLANLRCGYDENETAYGIAPSTSESRSFGGDIVTRDWIPKDTRIVHRSGDESISGVKTFSTVQSSDFNVTNGSLDFANPPSSNDNEYVDFIDGNSLTYSALQASCSSSQNVLRFRVRSLGDTTTDRSALNQMGLTATPTEVYGFCPTPSSTSENSTHIATTAWVRTATGNTALNAATASDLASGSVLSVAKGGTGLASLDTFVRTSGNQEISGRKIFKATVENRNNDLDFVNRTAENQNKYYIFADKNGAEISALQSSVNTTQNVLRFRVLRPGDTTTTISSGLSMGLIVESSDAYGYCPTPSSASDSSTKIATTKWIRTAAGNTSLNASTASDLASGAVLSVAKGGTGSTTLDDAGIVTKSGTQEITGSKTFNANRFNSNLRCFNGSFDISTVPSSALNRYFAFCSESTGDYCGGIQERNAPDQRSVRFVLRKYNDTTTATSLCAMAGFYVNLDGTKFWFASGNNGNNTDLGYTSSRWNNTYLVTAPDISSDERLKRFVSPIPDAVLDVWDSVPWVQYKLADACAGKGDAGARLHSGLVAQHVEKVFSDAGLDASVYGFFCHDFWGARSEEVDENGNVVEPARAAGDEYSIRYEEALCIEAAYMRRENARLRKRVADLEERLAALELRFGSE